MSLVRSFIRSFIACTTTKSAFLIFCTIEAWNDQMFAVSKPKPKLHIKENLTCMCMFNKFLGRYEFWCRWQLKIFVFWKKKILSFDRTKNFIIEYWKRGELKIKERIDGIKMKRKLTTYSWDYSVLVQFVLKRFFFQSHHFIEWIKYFNAFHRISFHSKKSQKLWSLSLYVSASRCFCVHCVKWNWSHESNTKVPLMKWI